MRTKPDVHKTDKFPGKIFVNDLRSRHNKFYPVAGSQIKNFGNLKADLSFLQFNGQIFLTDHQFPQFFQFDLFVCKGNNF